jgi:hypothetical protein
MVFPKQSWSPLSWFSSVSIFDIAVRLFLVFIPFSSFLSVFLVHKIGIPGAFFIKEIILAVAGLALAYTYIASYFGDKRYILKITKIDLLIAVYIVLFTVVSITTTGLHGIVYGGRYDFSFLLTFLIAYHGFPLLQKPLSYYLKIFLISAGSMLFISGLLKWPLHEDLLLYFGYSGNPSSWDFGGAPPIFHGIDGANVRRFQWILDNPNAMGAFLIMFSGIFAYFTRFRRDWYFVISIILLWLFGMVFYTYSRSALVGIVLAYTIVLIMSLRSLWQLYRMQLISVFVILALFAGSIGVLYYDKALAIVGRAGSTQWHSDRMLTGIKRVIDHPIGQWLGSAGPAYRNVIDLSNKTHNETIDLDAYYIPESWYIQQFIEGGVLGGILFLCIMMSFFVALMLVHPVLGALFAWVGTMNFFLHTFESSVVSLSLFFLIGIFLAYKNNAKK